MDRIKQAERYYKWKQFQHKNEEQILDWAYRNGISGSVIEFVLAEAFGRVMAVKGIRSVLPYAVITQSDLLSHYDMEVDGYRIETKFRLNDSDEYPTDDLSLKKTEWENIDLYINVFWDGVVRCYDIKYPCGEGEWSHNKTTATAGETITESRLSFCPDEALWTTTITMPDEFV